MDSYKDINGYIIKYIKDLSLPEEETNALHEPVEKEIAETKIPLGEKRGGE